MKKQTNFNKQVWTTGVIGVVAIAMIVFLMFCIGCNMVQDKESGELMHADAVPPGVATTPISPVDAIDKMAKDVAPFAALIPYGGSLLAALGVGAGLYRKYKPSIDGFRGMVKTIESLSYEAKEEYKKHLESYPMNRRTRIAVANEKIKSIRMYLT